MPFIIRPLFDLPRRSGMDDDKWFFQNAFILETLLHLAQSARRYIKLRSSFIERCQTKKNSEFLYKMNSFPSIGGGSVLTQLLTEVCKRCHQSRSDGI